MIELAVHYFNHYITSVKVLTEYMVRKFVLNETTVV